MYHQAPTTIASTTAANTAICMPWRELRDPLSRALFSSSSGSESPNLGRGNSGMCNSSATVAEELHIPELPLPRFGDSLPLDEEKSARESGSRSSRHGMQIAVFAAVVLAIVVGAWWYITQPSGGTHASAEPASSARASVISSPVESSHAPPQVNASVPANTSAQANPAALTSAPVQSNAASKTPSVVPAAV